MSHPDRTAFPNVRITMGPPMEVDTQTGKLRLVEPDEAPLESPAAVSTQK